MDKGFLFMDDNWKPPSPPEEGSERWKADTAAKWAIDQRLMNETALYKVPRILGYDMGYLAVVVNSNGGINYEWYPEIRTEEYNIEEPNRTLPVLALYAPREDGDWEFLAAINVKDTFWHTCDDSSSDDGRDWLLNHVYSNVKKTRIVEFEDPSQVPDVLCDETKTSN